MDVSEKCGDYNPTSGKCITCKAGDLPQNGVCCGVGMAWLKGRCVGAELKTLPTSDCLAVHPTMGYCIVCAEGYVVNSITMQDCVR